MRNRINRNHGFSLIEVIIAITILSIVTISLSPMIVYTVQQNQFNRGEFSSDILANRVMEEIKALDFHEIGFNHLPTSDDLHGVLTQNQQLNLDGRNFNVSIGIVLDSVSGYVPGVNDGDPDVKYVTVEVTSASGFFNQNSLPASKKVETMIARDFEQPFVPGSHMRAWVFKGWEWMLDNSDYTPVSNIKVDITRSGYSNSRLTSFRGSALFSGISPATYTVNPDLSGLNYITHPGSVSQNITTINNALSQPIFFIETPAKLEIDFSVINGTLPSTLSGEIRLSHSLYNSNDPNMIKSLSNAPTSQVVEMGNLWPVPESYSNVYGLATFIPNYRLAVNGVWDKELNQPWSGKFQSRGQTKPLTLYLYSSHVSPDDNLVPNSDWLNGASGTITSSINRKIRTNLQDSNYYLDFANFLRDHANHKYGDLNLNGSVADFIASKMYFTGSELDISNNSILKLETNFIRVNNVQVTGNNNDVVLSTLKRLPHNDDYDKHASLTVNSNPILISKDPTVVPYTVLGQNINSIFLSNPTAFMNSVFKDVEYGVLEVISTIKNDSVTLDPGIYYFPDGFSIKSDLGKTPQNGGLIKFAQ